MHHEHPDDIEEIEEKNGPLKMIGAIVLILLIIMMSVPYFGVKLDPEPRPIGPLIIINDNLPSQLNAISDVRGLEVSQAIRTSALSITTQACDGNDVCYLKSLYYYVRDNINYIKDPQREYIQHPEETLLGAGDCEDKAILLYMLMSSIGVEARIAIIPGHAYLQIKYQDLPGKYKDKEGWTHLDTTCEGCEFGEVPPGNHEKILRYI